MKYIVLSDIHGGIDELNKVLDIYLNEHCSKLLILGDLFDYGFSLNREDIINRINYMDNIIIVRGNCDYNINGIKHNMPYTQNTYLNNKKVTLTHGHLYNKSDLLDTDSDIIYIGHSHIPNIEMIGNKILVNPGSIAKSRSGENTFALIDDTKIYIRNLDNKTLFSKNI